VARLFHDFEPAAAISDSNSAALKNATYGAAPTHRIVGTTRRYTGFASAKQGVFDMNGPPYRRMP
jgi:hypothetical protein